MMPICRQALPADSRASDKSDRRVDGQIDPVTDSLTNTSHLAVHLNTIVWNHANGQDPELRCHLSVAQTLQG